MLVGVKQEDQRTYLATKTQACGGKIACALSADKGSASLSGRGVKPVAEGEVMASGPLVAVVSV